MPKISLIIPVYNVERYLRECLDSAVGQTLQDIEIIVVNDASPDNSQQIIADYAARDARIVALAHEHNRGLGAARNTGLERSRGEYIMFLDSDDTMEPNSCELLYRKICEHQADIVVAGTRRIDERSRPTGTICAVAKNRNPEEFFEDHGALKLYFNEQIGASVCNNIYRAELWHKNQLRFPCIRTGEDLYLICHILALCKKLVKINTILYNYRITTGSIINNPMTKQAINDLLESVQHTKEFITQNTKYHVLQDECRKRIALILEKAILKRILYGHVGIKVVPDPYILQYWLEVSPGYDLRQETFELFTRAFCDAVSKEQAAEFWYKFSQATLRHRMKMILKLLSQKMRIYPVYKYIKQKLAEKSI